MCGLADVIAAAMTEDHLQFLKGSVKEIRGMFRQRVLRDWGHAAHLGWARLLHDRRRDLIERHPTSHQHDEREFYANHFYQNREQFTARHKRGAHMPPVLPLILSSTPPPSGEPPKQNGRFFLKELPLSIIQGACSFCSAFL